MAARTGQALSEQYGQLTSPDVIIGRDPFTGEIVEGSGYTPLREVREGFGSGVVKEYNPKAFDDFMKMVRDRMEARIQERQMGDPTFDNVRATAVGGERSSVPGSEKVVTGAQKLSQIKIPVINIPVINIVPYLFLAGGATIILYNLKK